MADEWIKWVKGLSRRREVLAMARSLKKDRRIVACACMELWEWADSNTSTGQITGVTASDVDEEVGLRGFAKAMEDVGWLVVNDDGVTFPRWDRHNGTSAKRRATDRDRQRHHRDQHSDSCHDSVTQKSRSKRDKNVTREEKRREEREETDHAPPAHTHSPSLHAAAPSASESDGGAVRLVQDDEPPPPGLEPSTNPGADGPISFRLVKRLGELYPRQVALEEAYPEIEGAIRRIAKARGCDIRAACTWLAARVSAYAGSDEGKGEQRFVPFPARWFSQGRYNDDDGAWRRATPGSDAPAPDAIPAALARSLARGEQA